MAISRDGYIADKDGNTPWSDAEWESFNGFVAGCDVVLVGRKTYELMAKNDELIDNTKCVVVTSDTEYDAQELPTLLINSARDLPKANTIGIIGGGELNGRLAKLGLIDEIILDIEPIDLHEGIRLFGNYDIPLKLELISSKQIGQATIQRHYRVLG
jgi:dihydrofolate reductase